MAGALAGAFGGSFAPLPLAATGAPGLGRPPGTAQTPWSITVFNNRANVAGGTCPLHAPTLTPTLAPTSARTRARLARKSSRSVPVLLRLGRLGTCGPFRMLLRRAALQRSGRTGRNCAGHGNLYGIEQVVAKDDEPLICPPLKNLRGDSARMAYSVGAGLVARMRLPYQRLQLFPLRAGVCGRQDRERLPNLLRA